MKWILALVLPLVKGDVLWQDVCTQADVKSSVWCDITKPHDVRAAAFVAALKTAEKIPIMVNKNYCFAFKPVSTMLLKYIIPCYVINLA